MIGLHKCHSCDFQLLGEQWGLSGDVRFKCLSVVLLDAQKQNQDQGSGKRYVQGACYLPNVERNGDRSWLYWIWSSVTLELFVSSFKLFKTVLRAF